MPSRSTIRQYQPPPSRFGDPLRDWWAEQQNRQRASQTAGVLGLAGAGATAGAVAGSAMPGIGTAIGGVGGGAAGLLAGGVMALGNRGQQSTPQHQQQRVPSGRGAQQGQNQWRQAGTSDPMSGWESRAMRDPEQFARTSQQQGQGPIDPWAEFDPFAEQRAGIESAFDAQIAALAGLDPIYRQQAAEAQQNIGGFFDDARTQALGGVPVVQETGQTAQANIGSIYDDLGAALDSLPQAQSDLARAAGGSGMGGAVADRVSAAVAPFRAAGETARATGTSNVVQHSSAAENYLNQLAGSTQAEAGLHQSAVESALQEQLQRVAFQTAQLEGEKQMALARMSSDMSGSVAEQFANHALSTALGLEGLDPNVDPLDFLTGQNRMADLQGKGQQMEGRELQNLQRQLGLEDAMNPLSDTGLGDYQQFLGSLPESTQQNVMRDVPRILNIVEGELENLQSMGQSVNDRTVQTTIDKSLNQFFPPASRDNPQANQARDTLRQALMFYLGA